MPIATGWKAALYDWRQRRVLDPAADLLANLPLVTDTDLRRDQTIRLDEIYPEGVEQFDAMLTSVGLDTKFSPLMAAIRVELYLNCTKCTRRPACRHWLARKLSNAGYRHFCPNASMFDHLIGRDRWRGLSAN